ncbi:hypothetical protein CQW23_09622 [Capsicum baccatum]|uniref:non-specific serine/threonine protein kinase n=1 Tax=Capsicum baccatum TaxID=33114 RepID=A0A2G2WXC3_CAPBA|nr:hypothetical protein CQW23_09622 [Capsicum baccatum]
MHVFFNNLSGEIPSCFGNISSIRLISLIANNFHGTMPDFLGKLGNLEILELAQNNLSGAIPALVFNLSSLRNLELSLNQLEGPIPSSMGFTLPKLEVFNLGANQLTGVLPASVSNLTNLQLFAVDTNNFSGEVPSFGSSQNLYWLGLGENCLGNGKLDGLLFMSFSQNCSALQLLQIDGNQFGGVIPRYFGNMSSLLYLTMSRHLIHGIIPVEISQLRSLQELSLQQNHLTGEIPDSIGEFELLNELHLNENQLSGKIPSCIGNLTMLTKLSLGANNLHGSIPSSLGKIKFLSLLNLSRNHLSGDIPKEILQLPEALLHLDLSRNHITGSLAPVNNTICLKNLVYLRLSNNNLSGEIPSSFKILTSLTELYVDNNYLQGAIPPSLSSLTSPEFIDLFTQQICENKSRFSITGNNKLCGSIPEFKLPKCPKNDPSSGKSSRMMILIIALVVGGIVGIIAMAILHWRYNRKRKQRVADNQGSTVMDAVIPRVTYQGLQKATNGFSLENSIGWGNFSSVYKGNLDESVDGIKQIAVKIANWLSLMCRNCLIVNDEFQVAAIIEKLLPMWKDIKNYLKHKRKEMTVKNFIVRLRIEDDNKAFERRSKGNSTINGAHIVEDDQNNPKKRKKVEQGSNRPKKKFKGKCFNCGKIVHNSTDCRAPKKGKKKDQANMIESNKQRDDLCAIFSECNLVENPR